MLTGTLERTWNHARAAQAALQLKMSSGAAAQEAAKRHLAERLGRLRGLPQKVGQMLSFSWAESESSELAILQNAAPALPLANLLPSLAKAWRRPIEDIVESIDSRGHAASIGQVHRAKLKDGRDVAIKIQFPGIRDAIETDLKMLGWMSLPMGGFDRGFDLPAYQKAIRENLDRELNYAAELQTQTRMHALSRRHPRIAIPEPIAELSTPNVLVTHWIDAEPWDVAAERLTPGQRQILSESLLEYFVDGLLRQGAMQSDWHPGNVRVRHGAAPQWVLFDFGAPCLLTDDSRKTILTLLASPPAEEEAWNRLLALGFSSQWLAPLRKKLPDLCAILFEPFYASGEFNLNAWRLSERMAEVLGEDRWNFRIAAPPVLLPLMRAFHGLIYYLRGLHTPLNWRKSLESFAGSGLAPQPPIAPALSAPVEPPPAQAESLKLRVIRGGETVALLTFPASAAERLETLVDDDLALRIRREGIDLAAIGAAEQVRSRRKGPLFTLNDETRSIEVWLA